MNRPTIADVAKRAGVGTATVDRVLSGRRKVRRETANRVYIAAEKIGYYAASVIKHRIKNSAPKMSFGFIMPKENQEFYKIFSNILKMEVNNCELVRGASLFQYATTQNPTEYESLIEVMSDKTDIIAASSISHDKISRIVSKLRERGLPVFSMLNDFAPGIRQNFIGLDNYRAGRLAGWILNSTIRESGIISIMLGGNQWGAHQLREVGFRTYFRERNSLMELQDSVLNLETQQFTYEMVLDLLETKKNLKGVYITGGGVEGAIRALRENNLQRQVKIVVHPRTEETELALRDEIITAIIATPLRELARLLVLEMANIFLARNIVASQDIYLEPQILLPEYF